MKKAFFFYLLLPFYVFSQDYNRVDATIQLYPETVASSEELSKFIARDFLTEEEQVRAIYSWKITNIAYHPEEYKKFDYTFKNFRERNQKEEKTRSKIIARTLQNGIAVYEGYAFVFEKLCNDLGIENYLIQGDTKTHFIDIGRDFNKNTAWVEGNTDFGIGEFIEYCFDFSEMEEYKGDLGINRIILANGYKKNKLTWKNNSRVKQLKVYLNDRPYAILNLLDSFEIQTIEMGEIKFPANKETILKFEITQVYEGKKYKDTAISLLMFEGMGVH